MRKLIAITALLICAQTVGAQVTGTVLAADNSPAAYATVLLYADSNTAASPIGYGLTTSDGYFALADGAPEQWLVVRHLGSKEYRSKIKTRQHMRIRLEADVQSLDEVMVKSTYLPVQVHGDTISFSTDYYRTGAEETAAEVLQQIPGMEVSESGEVSYAGKTVDKVLVDGKDMFASGSDGALNTLPADAIRGAEMLMNYRSGSLIDQFSGRELTALNIKTDGKHRLSGRVSASGGWVEKGRADASLLYMGSKLSLTSILGANNTGEALFSLEDYIKTVVGLDNILSSSGEGFNPSEEELSMLMPPSNVYASKSGLATVSGTWTPSNKFKAKGNLMLNGTALDAASFSQQQYLAINAMQSHLTDQHSNSLFLTGHLQETWRPSDKVEVSNLTQITRTNLFTSDSLDESGLSTLLAGEDNRLEKKQWKEELAVNIKTGEQGLLSAHLQGNATKRNYSYNLLTDNALLPSVAYDTLVDGLLQLDTRRQITDTRFAPDITYAFNIAHRLTLATTVAYEHRESAFEYNDAAIDENLAWNTLTGTVRLSKQRGLLRFSLGTHVRRTQWSSTLEGLADSATVDVLPFGQIGLAFSESHRLTLSGSLDRSPIELEYLLRAPIVDGYSRILAGSEITNPFSRTASAQLNYYLFDLFTNTMFFAFAGISDSRFNVQAHMLQDSSIASSSVYNNDGDFQMRYANVSLRQGLGRLPWDVTVSGNLSQSTSTIVVNGTDANMSTLAYGGRLGINSRRKSPLNFDFGGNLNFQQSMLAGGNNKLWEAGGHAALLLAWPRFTAQLRIAYSHVESDISRDLWDLGIKAEYKVKRWRLTLRGGNLLHLNEQEWVSTATTPLYFATTTYRRLPGYLLLGVAYRF